MPVLLIITLLTSYIQAKTFSLYEVELPVQSQDNHLLSDKLPRAFEYILIRMSGDREIVKNNPELQELNMAQKAISSYHFQLHDCPIPSAQPCNYLAVSFHAENILAILKKVGKNPWLTERATSFVDIHIENELETKVIHQNEEEASLVEQVAAERGIQVFLPNQNTFTDEGSENTQTDQTLTVKIHTSNQIEWLISWQLFTQEGTFEWETSKPSLNSAITESIHTLADFMASQQRQDIQPSTQEHESFIKIKQIANYSELNRVMKKIQSNKQISQAKVSQIDADTIYMAVQHKDGLDSILKSLQESNIQVITDSFNNGPLNLNRHSNYASVSQ